VESTAAADFNCNPESPLKWPWLLPEQDVQCELSMASQGGHTRGLYGPKQARSWRPTRSVPDRVCRPGTTPGLGCITREELSRHVIHNQPSSPDGREVGAAYP
ncbi:Metal resistance protein YCF1, partial [Giardia duodenalis]